MSLDLLQQGTAIVLAGIIFARAVCVVYSTHPSKHKHLAQFLGFGYSYVTLGAGAAFSAVELCTASDLGGLPLWLMLAGSCGLIVFDRRMAKCWTVSECPMDRDRRSHPR